MNQLQQGDVLLKRISSLPTNLKKAKEDRRGIVLAHGENGHWHSIDVQDGVELYEQEGTLFLHTEKEVELTHQEHNTIKIPIGDYEIGRVREMDYTQMMVRPVSD